MALMKSLEFMYKKKIRIREKTKKQKKKEKENNLNLFCFHFHLFSFRNLQSNQLKGPIPTEFEQMDTLQTLYVIQGPRLFFFSLFIFVFFEIEFFVEL